MSSFGYACFHTALLLSCLTSLRDPLLSFFPNFSSPFLRLWVCTKQCHSLPFLFLLSISQISIWHITNAKILTSFALQDLVCFYFTENKLAYCDRHISDDMIPLASYWSRWVIFSHSWTWHFGNRTHFFRWTETSQCWSFLPCIFIITSFSI